MSDSDSENEAPEVPATNGPAKAGKQDKQEDLSGAESALADYIRCVFNGLVSEKVLEANLKKASKDPGARNMIKLLAGQAAAPGRKKRAKNGEKKEKSQLVRNAYQVYVRDALSILNEHAGEQGEDGSAIKHHSLMQVAQLWKRLPDDMKAEMNERFSKIKERINAQVQEGATHVDAHAEVQKFNKEQKLKPYNYPVLLQKYGSADDAAATGKGNGSAAAGPSKAAGGDDAAAAEKKRKHDDDEARREKKKKKKDKEKNEGGEGNGSGKGNGTGKGNGNGDKEEKKKKKKHKHKEEGGGAEA